MLNSKYGLITAPSHIVLAAANEFKDKTTRVNEMWQTDFTYFKIIAWGWYFMSTVMDDYSRYIISWDIRSNMTSEDVKPSIIEAMKKTGLSKNTSPKPLSDNGSYYISNEIKSLFKQLGIKAINGKPCHPQTQGKIERYHRTMKNVIKLENYYSPEDLKYSMAAFVDYYNNHRYHESLNNLTPADVYFGRGKEILRKRSLIKQETMKKRRRNYYREKHIELTLV